MTSKINTMTELQNIAQNITELQKGKDSQSMQKIQDLRNRAMELLKVKDTESEAIHTAAAKLQLRSLLSGGNTDLTDILSGQRVIGRGNEGSTITPSPRLGFLKTSDGLDFGN